ncbi:MAG: serine/threonine-protein phosphatase [Prevotella sp.]|nr:serine/threonine-protein phosphatase [Prevotella sp.]
MKRIYFFALMLTAASLLALTACKSEKPSEEGHTRALRQIQIAYEERDYQELLRLADSLCTIGELSEPEAYYWQGYASDRTKQLRMAEFYWKTAVAQTSNSTEPEDLAIYAKSASHLANVLGSRGEYEVVLDIIQPVVNRLKELKCDTMSDYNNLVLMIGLCQSRFGLSRDAANESYEQAYQTHMKNIEEHRSDQAYKNAIAGVVNIAYNCNETKSYRDALLWIDRYGELIRQYEQRNGADPAYVDRQWARYDIYRTIALDGLGKKDEAAKVYEHYLTTQYSRTPEGRIAVNDYLAAASRWEEVAENYECLDDLLGHKNYSIEDFQKMVLPKFKANLQAGRRDSAMAVALDISHSLDTAITEARKQDAQELAVIRQKAEKLAADEALAIRQRTNNLFLALALVFGGFAVYTYYRHRKTLRGIKKHRELKEAYNELENTKTMVNKAILEQEISRNIQLAMTPDAPPQNDDIRLFASLKPADATDCDLYDYFVSNDKFFFCIGDAKGTGINASTSMAITRTEFRSLASDKVEPAEIVTSINKKLTDRKNPDMAVTLLLGILDLTTGRLRYTNAEQTAPLLVGSGIGLLPVDKNAAVGTHPDYRYSTQETRIDPGTLIFLYTQDLLEAKNDANDSYGHRRMLGESLQASKMLSEKLTPEAFDKWMKEAIARFTGKEAADVKLTTFTFQYKQIIPGAPYQRSISISNDPKDEAYIAYFTKEACTAVGMKEKASGPIAEEMENVVKNLMKEAYPDGTKGDVHIEVHAEDDTLQFTISAGTKTVTISKNITN